MKNTVKLNESQLRKIVAESVKKVLNEDYYSAKNIISLAIDEAYKELHERKNSIYDVWNLGMNLYWKIDKLIKRQDREEEIEKEERNTYGGGFYDDVFQDEIWAKQERDGI